MSQSTLCLIPAATPGFSTRDFYEEVCAAKRTLDRLRSLRIMGGAPEGSRVEEIVNKTIAELEAFLRPLPNHDVPFPENMLTPQLDVLEAFLEAQYYTAPAEAQGFPF